MKSFREKLVKGIIIGTLFVPLGVASLQRPVFLSASAEELQQKVTESSDVPTPEQASAEAIAPSPIPENSLDATDARIFGKNALVPDSPVDQSYKLILCLNTTGGQQKKLYLPKGTYIMTKSRIFNSGSKVIGDKNGGTILKNNSGSQVTFGSKNNYNRRTYLSFEYIFFDSLAFITDMFNEINFEHNVFYNPLTDMQIDTNNAQHMNVAYNIFLRDLEHVQPHPGGGGARWNRCIYVGGYATSSRYSWQYDTTIKENLFGAKLDELDALKSVQNSAGLTETIEMLQNALATNPAVSENLKNNDQNNFATYVSSFSTLKKLEVLNNVFYSNRDNADRGNVMQDHPLYLRGSQDVVIAGNHFRGWQNGTGGGLKFKSGRNVTIMNNYFRNTGIIFYDTAEYGLSEKKEMVPELSNFLVKDNQFDWKYWDGSYSIGMEHNKQSNNAVVKNGVFLNNHYTHFNNIGSNSSNRKRNPALANANGATEFVGFRPEHNSHISGNTRDDGVNGGVLGARTWTPEDFAAMNPDWESIYKPENYDQYNALTLPFKNTLPIAVPTTIQVGETVDPTQLVSNTNDKDEVAPTATIADPSVLTQPGTHEIPVTLTYSEGRITTINVPVTVVAAVN